MDDPTSPPNSGQPIQFGLGTLLAIMAGFAALFSLVAILQAVGFFLAVLAVGLLLLARGGPNRAKLLVLGGQLLLVTLLLGMCTLSALLFRGASPGGRLKAGQQPAPISIQKSLVGPVDH